MLVGDLTSKQRDWIRRSTEERARRRGDVLSMVQGQIARGEDVTDADLAAALRQCVPVVAKERNILVMRDGTQREHRGSAIVPVELVEYLGAILDGAIARKRGPKRGRRVLVNHDAATNPEAILRRLARERTTFGDAALQLYVRIIEGGLKQREKDRADRERRDPPLTFKNKAQSYVARKLNMSLRTLQRIVASLPEPLIGH